jgi:hypothetical protein
MCEKALFSHFSFLLELKYNKNVLQKGEIF